MTELKTEDRLLRALRQASKRQLTADELHQQRVSFIVGALKESSGVTRSKVQDVLAEQEGRVRS